VPQTSLLLESSPNPSNATTKASGPRLSALSDFRLSDFRFQFSASCPSYHSPERLSASKTATSPPRSSAKQRPPLGDKILSAATRPRPRPTRASSPRTVRERPSQDRQTVEACRQRRPQHEQPPSTRSPSPSRRAPRHLPSYGLPPNQAECDDPPESCAKKTFARRDRLNQCPATTKRFITMIPREHGEKASTRNSQVTQPSPPRALLDSLVIRIERPK